MTNLPRQPPFILAPAALAHRAAVADDRVPVAVCLVLIVGDDLKRKRFAVFEVVSAVEAQTGHAAHREFNRQDIARLAARIVGWRPMHRVDHAVGKGSRVKTRGLFRITDIRQTICVLAHFYAHLSKSSLSGDTLPVRVQL